MSNTVNTNHSISRTFISKSDKYNVKGSDGKDKNLSTQLQEAGKSLPTVDAVIDLIKTPGDNNLFKSTSKYFGPVIPKSAQKLLAAAYINENKDGAFIKEGKDINKFNFIKFKEYFTQNGLENIANALKESYFDNIKITTTIANLIHVDMAATTSDHFFKLIVNTFDEAVRHKKQNILQQSLFQTNNNKSQKNINSSQKINEVGSTKIDIIKLHNQIDLARSIPTNEIIQTCLLDAYVANLFIQGLEINKSSLTKITDVYNGLEDGQINLDMQILMNCNEIDGILDQNDKNKITDITSQQQENKAAQQRKGNIIKNKNDSPYECSRTNYTKNNTEDVNILYIAFSHIYGINNNDKENMVETVRDNYPDGCVILKKTTTNDNGHYVYYHPSCGVISGGKNAYDNKLSGISLVDYLNNVCDKSDQNFYTVPLTLWL